MRLGLLMVVLLAGCTAPAAVVQAPAPHQSSASSDITLAFGGDVHFMDRTRDLLGDPATAFGKIAPVLAKADLSVVNLETSVTVRGTPEPKEFLFRAPASAFDAVKSAGIDAVSIANNHALDYGQVGLADTLEAARERGVPALGGGPAGEAYKPWITEVRGTRIAFVAMSQVGELWQRWEATDTKPGLAMLRNPLRALAAVKTARAQADVVVVLLHWGTEYQECPSEELQGLAKQLIDAGADLLVGGHQHLLLGAGWSGHAYVAYGLGNFLWWRNDAMSNETGVLWITIRGKKVVSGGLIPAYIDRATGQPYPVNGEVAAHILDEQKRLRACAELGDQAGN